LTCIKTGVLKTIGINNYIITFKLTNIAVLHINILTNILLW